MSPPCRVAAVVLTAPRSAADPPAEKWAAGSKHVLRWDTAKFPVGSAVTVELSTDGGKTWAQAAGGANTGRLVWTVPEKPVEAARLRVHAGKPAEALVIGGAFSVGPSQEVKDYEWVQVNKAAAFAPRDGAGALTYKGRMWFLGGWNPGDKKNFPRICNNEVWNTADGKTWDLVKANTFLDSKFDRRRTGKADTRLATSSSRTRCGSSAGT